MLGEFSQVGSLYGPIVTVTMYSMRQSYCISSGLHEKGLKCEPSLI